MRSYTRRKKAKLENYSASPLLNFFQHGDIKQSLLAYCNTNDFVNLAKTSKTVNHVTQQELYRQIKETLKQFILDPRVQAFNYEPYSETTFWVTSEYQLRTISSKRLKFINFPNKETIDKLLYEHKDNQKLAVEKLLQAIDVLLFWYLYSATDRLEKSLIHHENYKLPVLDPICFLFKPQIKKYLLSRRQLDLYDLRVIQKSLDRKLNDCMVNLQRTPIISEKDIAFVKSLLDHGANPNFDPGTTSLPDEDRKTAFEKSLELNNLPIIRLMINTGAKINNVHALWEVGWGEAMTPLMFAAFKGYAECVQLLLDSGAEVNFRYRRECFVAGLPAIACAIRQGKVPVIKILLEHGASLNFSNSNQNNPIQMAMQYRYSCKNPDDVVNCLLAFPKSGLNIEHRNNVNLTPLLMAASWRHSSVVKSLIIAGADLKATDYRGKTALDLVKEGIKQCGLLQSKSLIDLLVNPEEFLDNLPLRQRFPRCQTRV